MYLQKAAAQQDHDQCKIRRSKGEKITSTQQMSFSRRHRHFAAKCFLHVATFAQHTLNDMRSRALRQKEQDSHYCAT